MSNTLNRIKAHLADPNNYAYGPVRKPFVTSTGVDISIQQSDVHHCDSSSVEMGFTSSHALIEEYGDGAVYNFVPLEVVAQYIDHLESL